LLSRSKANRENDDINQPTYYPIRALNDITWQDVRIYRLEKHTFISSSQTY